MVMVATRESLVVHLLFEVRYYATCKGEEFLVGGASQLAPKLYPLT
jgi:hypothetical protein